MVVVVGSSSTSHSSSKGSSRTSSHSSSGSSLRGQSRARRQPIAQLAISAATPRRIATEPRAGVSFVEPTTTAPQQHQSQQQRRQQPYQQPQFQRQQSARSEQSETSTHCTACNIRGHTAENCYRAQGRCLICRAYDHRARDYPRSRQQAPPAPPQGQGQRGRGRRRGPPHQQQV